MKDSRKSSFLQQPGKTQKTEDVTTTIPFCPCPTNDPIQTPQLLTAGGCEWVESTD